MYIESVKNFLCNFYTTIDYHLPYELTENGDDYEIKMPGAIKTEENNNLPKLFEKHYKKYIDYEDYKNYLDGLMSKNSGVFDELKPLFKELVIDKVNNDISLSSFKELILEKDEDEREDYVKEVIDNKVKQYNKYFSIKAMKLIPQFILNVTDEATGYKDFDFILSQGESDYNNFSAIR